MQEEINKFNAAFVDLAVDYVNRIAIRAAQKEPETKGAARQFRYELANDIQIAKALADTIRKMQKASGGELPQDGCVQLEPGTEINLRQPLDLEDVIRKTVAETFREWEATAKYGGCVVFTEEEIADIERAVQEAGPGMIVNLAEEEGHTGTASAAAAWKVLEVLGYVNERPFQETQDFLTKVGKILEILKQSGISPEYWDGVIGMAATFDVHMRG